MTLKRFFVLPLLAILPMVLAPAVAAEKGTVQAIIPWDGEGKVYQVNTSTIVFLGSEDKLIPVETAKKFDADLKAAGVQSEVWIYEGQPHGFFTLLTLLLKMKIVSN